MALPPGFVDRLRRVDTTVASIQTLREFMLLHVDGATGGGAGPLVSAWAAETASAPTPSRLALFYLANDVLQATVKQKPAIASAIVAAFTRHLPRVCATIGASSAAIVPQVKRVLQVWRDREVLPPDVLATLTTAVEEGKWHGNDSDAVEDAASAAAGSGGGGVSAPAPTPMSQVAMSLDTLEKAVLPHATMAANLLHRSGGEGEAEAEDATQQWRSPAIAGAIDALQAVQAAEVPTGLHRDDAFIAMRVVNTSIVEEDVLATGLTSRAELLARTDPFDPRPSCTLVTQYQTELEAEKNAREVALERCVTALEEEMKHSVGDSTAGVVSAAEELTRAQAMLTAIHVVQQRVRELKSQWRHEHHHNHRAHAGTPPSTPPPPPTPPAAAPPPPPPERSVHERTAADLLASAIFGGTFGGGGSSVGAPPPTRPAVAPAAAPLAGYSLHTATAHPPPPLLSYNPYQAPPPPPPGYAANPYIASQAGTLGPPQPPYPHMPPSHPGGAYHR